MHVENHGSCGWGWTVLWTHSSGNSNFTLAFVILALTYFSVLYTRILVVCYAVGKVMLKNAIFCNAMKNKKKKKKLVKSLDFLKRQPGVYEASFRWIHTALIVWMNVSTPLRYLWEHFFNRYDFLNFLSAFLSWFWIFSNY